MFIRKSNIYLPFKENVLVVKTFLDEKNRLEILNAIEEDGSYNYENYSNNLIETKRTDWFYHENEKFKPFYDNVIKKVLFDGMENFAIPNPCYRDALDDVTYSIETTNCWFAKSTEKSHVYPHIHGNSYGFFSYSCYLKLPSSRTSLTFSSKSLLLRETIEVKEGDILIFPSDLIHWTNDIENERSILSGNFILCINISNGE